jgi:cytoskeleton protein RodZ
MPSRNTPPPYHIEPESDALPPDFHTELSVGEILHRARLSFDLSLDQVEAAIRIRASHIESMENNQFSALPGRAYIFGFIRTYAEFLGLDGEKMVELLRRQSGNKVSPRPVLAVSIEEEDQRLPGWQVAASAAILLFSVLGLIAAFSSSGREEENIAVPGVPADLSAQLKAPTKPATTAPSSAESVASTTQETTTEEPPLGATPHHPVILRAEQNVWMEIRDGAGKPVFSRVLAQGEEYWVPPDQSGLVMTLGNAGGLRFIVEGKELPFLGREGQVRRGIKLEPDFIRGLAGIKKQ